LADAPCAIIADAILPIRLIFAPARCLPPRHCCHMPPIVFAIRARLIPDIFAAVLMPPRALILLPSDISPPAAISRASYFAPMPICPHT